MTNTELLVSHPVLQALDSVVRDDGFEPVSAEDDETRYTSSDAGWTTRIRALVRTYEPDCTCPYCPFCDHDTYQTLMLEIEMERDGLGGHLRGYYECELSEALGVYGNEVRPLVASFPLRLHRLKSDQLAPEIGKWEDTPFHATHILEYLGNMRWQDGRLDEAARCHEALLGSAMCKVPHRRAAVDRDLDELRRGVRYEDRTGAARCR